MQQNVANNPEISSTIIIPIILAVLHLSAMQAAWPRSISSIFRSERPLWKKMWVLSLPDISSTPKNRTVNPISITTVPAIFYGQNIDAKLGKRGSQYGIKSLGLSVGLNSLIPVSGKYSTS